MKAGLMRFAPEFLDEIRARVPISALIGTRVSFDAKKSNAARGDFWACCPFHREKTPSFHCDDGRGRYHCFGCGASGDVFRFLTELDGISFFDAVEQLSNMAGLPMPKQDEATKEKEQLRTSLYDVLEQTNRFFERGLMQGTARSARDYLVNRGLNEGIIRQFRLGYAADSRTALREHLTKAGIGLDLMERAGLLVTGEDISVPYDRFRHRIIFPITDLKNRIIGFGGRALSDKTRAKYLNSPETELFHKGHMLYNLATARQALRQGQSGTQEPRPLIVVEGYMDVIGLARAGISQAVAPLGTAITEEQLHLLWRTAPTPILCFDGDAAGLNAALRVLDRALPLLKTGFSLKFMILPEGKDPDDLVREGGGEAFSALLHQAVPLAEMLWQHFTRGKIFETPESRAILEKNLTKALFTIMDESLRHYYLQDMRTRLRSLFAPPRRDYNNKVGQQRHGRYERGLGQRQNFEQRGVGGNVSNLATSRIVLGPGFSLREAAILVMLVNQPVLWEENFERLEKLEFSHIRLKALHQAMLDVLAEWHPQDGMAMRRLLSERGHEPLIKEIDALMAKIGLRTALPAAPFEDVHTTLNQALHLHMRAHTLHKQLREIEAELLENPQSHHFSMLATVQAELEKTDATQALIDGFGSWVEK